MLLLGICPHLLIIRIMSSKSQQNLDGVNLGLVTEERDFPLKEVQHPSNMYHEKLGEYTGNWFQDMVD